MHRHRSLVTGAAVVGLTLSLGLAACGSDKEDAKTSAKSDKTDQTAATATPAADKDKGFCADYVAVSLKFNDAPGNQGPDDNPKPEQVKAWYTKNAAALIDQIGAEKPAAVESDLQVMLDAVTPMGATGDGSKVGSPEASAAQGKVDAWVKDNCDNVTFHDVKAVDYGYEGLKKTLPAGPSAFTLTNGSANGEMHEMAIARKNDGVTESFTELLKLPDDQAMAKVTLKGMVFVPPGGTSTGYADLEPGQYIAVCFIPKGATQSNPDGNGPPHMMLGMQQEFTVS